MEENTKRSEEFLKQLREIEEEATRLLENAAFDKLAKSTKMQEKSVELMVAMINFFDAALHYFGKAVLGKSFYCLHAPNGI